MRGQRGHSDAGVRRLLTLAVLALTAVAMLAIGVPTSAHAASPADSKPRLRDAAVSAKHLPDTGGVVQVSAATVATKRCKLQVRPAITRKPPAKSCVGEAVRWSVHLPVNAKALAVKYHLTISATGAKHRPATDRHRTVTVAPTTAPPTITSFAPNRPQLEFVGGEENVVVTAAANLTCALTITPAIPAAPADGPCTHPTTRFPLAFPANDTMVPVTYTVGLTVTGTHSQQVVSSTTVTVGAHPPPCPGQTSAATPTTTAFFNDPTTHVTADQNRVVDAEINLICDAQLPVKGAPTRIAMGMYVYQLDRVSQALLWAQKYMHASVHLLLDGSNAYIYAPDGTVIPNPAYLSVLNGLPPGSVMLCGPNAGATLPPKDDGGDDGTGVFPSGTGCAGDNIMHTKLLVVSAVDAAGDPAVFSSSQNLAVKGENAAMNNGLQIVGNDAAYTQDLRYLTLIAQNKPQADVGGIADGATVALPGATATSEFFPRNVPAAFPKNENYHASNDQPTDSVAKLLKTVDCKNPGASAGTHADGPARTSIRIAISAYNKRPLVTAALQDLASAGCDIKVVYTKMSTNTLGLLQGSGITALQLNDEAFPYTDGSGTGLIFIHDKYLLISGGLKVSGTTKSNQDLVLTGSACFTQRSLHRNDESSLTYQQNAAQTATPIFDSFAANWDHLAAIIASIPPPAG